MNRKQPALSVIVPVYNVEQYLDKCVRSIVGQTYRDLEIILVDDGSTDCCGKICDEWGQKDSRIKVLHKKNGGVVSARNAGLYMASGEYIAYVDSDDWIEKDMYDCLMNLILRDGSDLVTSGLIRDYKNHSVYEKEKIYAGRYSGKALEKLLPQLINTNHFFDSQINMHITNKVFKKENLLQYQKDIPEDTRIGEDAAIIYPYIFESECISVSGKNFYHYVLRNDSAMGSGPHARSIDIMQNVFDRCIARNRDKIVNIKEQLYQVIAFFSFMSEPYSQFRMKSKEFFTFKDIKKGDRIILYGAGRFGKAVRLLLDNEGYCEIAAWTDKVKGKDIIPPESIMEYRFDKIMLAVLNAAVADDVEQMLIELGVDKKKICRAKV